MKHFKAICWDLDGTLLENDHSFDQALEAVCKKHNVVLPPTLPHGFSLRDIWPSLGVSSHVSFEVFVEDLDAHCKEALHENSLKPFVLEALILFQKNNKRQSIVSNSPRHMIHHGVKTTKISHYFHHWIGRDDVALGKPSPEPYLLSCKLHGLDPSQCLAIEDSPLGAEAAKRAGLTVIACPSFKTKHLDFKHADYVVEELSQLPEFLKNKY